MLKDDSFRYFGKNNFLPKKVGSKIFMYTASAYTMKDPGFFERPLIVSYDLISQKTKPCNISYPNFAKEFCWSEHHFDVPFTANNKNELIVSFPFTDDIYVYDIAKDEIVKEIVDAKSKYVDKVIPYNACDFTNPEKYFSYLKSVSRYYSLTYDKYKNVYYRIVLLPSDEIDGKRNDDIVMPMSIMVLDGDFQVISEKRLEKRIYNYKDFFVDSEGFWLSRNNTGNDNFNENELSFSLFNFRDKK